MSTYRPVIGLEIHTELKTRTKMFCYSLNDPDEKHPNVNVCPICMGHPGTLPVINQEAVEKVIMTGLALNGKVAEFSQFDRKNYFYPDLPKGYQISQYQHPLVTGGYLDLEMLVNKTGGNKFSILNSQFSNKSQNPNANNQTVTKRIRIRRIHLEEDTGRLVHDSKTNSSLVDFNRAGVPLLELVTEPDLYSSEEVKKLGEDLQRILRYLEVSDADMEKGQLRVEVNISLLPREFSISKIHPLGEFPGSARRKQRYLLPTQFSNDKELGTKVEIKNINSFKFAAEAIDYEIARQAKLLGEDKGVIAETRGWNEFKKETFSQRQKEEVYDYRYFPEPDLPPLKIAPEFIKGLKVKLPELPEAKRIRLAKEYEIDQETTAVLIKDKKLADYFEETVSELRTHLKESPIDPKKDLVKLAALVMVGDLQSLLKEMAMTINDLAIAPENFAELILYLGQEKISNLVFKKVLAEMFRSKDDPSDIIERLSLWQISDTKDLEDVARHIARENSQAVEDYHRGKEASLQFLVGQVMKESRGKANPKIVREILKKILGNDVSVF